MYLWQRFATRKWADRNQEKLCLIAGTDLVIIEQLNRKRLQFQVASDARTDLLKLAKQFGGRIEKLPADWKKRALRQKTKPIKVGDRTLIIPAGLAFGTGQHATTAMSLRLLERLTHNRDLNWSLVDLGTGSGILALAAKVLGARHVVGIDNDPMAISTAKQNARLNKVRGLNFRVADLRQWRLERKVDVVTANLFSELLIEILPKLRSARWLIFSGILRNQEADLRRALTRQKVEIWEARRRGKWVAILAGRK